MQWDRFNVIDSVVERKVKVGPCIWGSRHWRATVRTAAQVCSPSGGWEGLIDLIVCAHSSATPAAGHTQWADCAWGCQMTAARGCPSQPKYVIADHGHPLENSWEHNVINSDKKERENKEKDVPVQKWIVLSVSCCRLRGISGKGSKEFVQMLTWLGQRLWIGVTGLLSARECESDKTQSI